jgi:hypothetical protein
LRVAEILDSRGNRRPEFAAIGIGAMAKSAAVLEGLSAGGREVLGWCGGRQ